MKTRSLHARCHILTKPISQKETRQSTRANPRTSPHKLGQDLKEDAGPDLDELREIGDRLLKDVQVLQWTWDRSMGKLRAIWHMTGNGRMSQYMNFLLGQARWRREKTEFLSDEIRINVSMADNGYVFIPKYHVFEFLSGRVTEGGGQERRRRGFLSLQNGTWPRSLSE